LPSIADILRAVRHVSKDANCSLIHRSSASLFDNLVGAATRYKREKIMMKMLATPELNEAAVMAGRRKGGYPLWTDEDMAKFEGRWPRGTHAPVIFDILATPDCGSATSRSSADST